MSECKKAEPVEGDPRNYLGIEFEHIFGEDRNVAKFYGAIKKRPALAALCEQHHELLSYTSTGVLYGYEATLLVPQEDYKAPLRDLLNLLQTYEATVVEGRCGLHVHVDLRHRGGTKRVTEWSLAPHPVKSAINNRKSELLVYCAEHRRKDTYREGTHDLIVGRMGYQTIEVRYMEANFDFPRICKYIDKLVEIADEFLVVNEPALAAVAA